jgi:hypothetical protein
MNWIEKVKYLIERDENEQPGDPFFYDVCFSGNCWQPGEINEIIQEYPWLPKSYLDFIAEFDGISIAFLRFYGSKNGDAIPLYEILNESKPYLKDDYFPFGRDPGGSNFIMNKNGQIFLWDEWDYEFEEEPKWLANSMEEFLDECILGKRYAEFNKIEKDNYYNFLKSMDWA